MLLEVSHRFKFVCAPVSSHTDY